MTATIGLLLAQSFGRTATVVWDADNPELQAVWSTDRNWDGGVAPSPGDSLVFGGGVLPQNANDFPLNTSFTSITLTNDMWDITGNALTLTASANAVLWNPVVTPSNDNILEMPIRFASPGATVSTLASANSLIFTGLIDNGSNLLQVSAVAGGTVALAGQVTGSGGLTKIGAGRLVLASPVNNYAGDTTIIAGTLGTAIAKAIPSGPGAGDLIVQGTLDLNGTGQQINGLSGTGVVTNSSSIDSSGRGVLGSGSPAFADLEMCVHNVAKTFTFDGSIQGPVNLAKMGAQPILVLSHPNSYTGTTTVHAGVLRMGVDNALPVTTILILGSATNDVTFDLAGFNQQVAGLRRDTSGLCDLTNSGGPATLTFSKPGGAALFAGRILDRPLAKVSLTIAGGALALRNVGSTYRGLTLVTNAGSALTVWTRNPAAGQFVVANGTTFGVSLSASNDTLNAESLTIGASPADQETVKIDLGRFGKPTNAPITAGQLTINGTVTLNVDWSKPRLGQFPLLKYSGAIGGAGFGGFILGSLPQGVTAQLVNNASGSSVDLKITDSVGSLAWTGNTLSGPVNSWDIGLMKDWADVVTGLPAAYTETKGIGPLVFFDDTASNGVVYVTTRVKPFSVTFNNSGVIGSG